MKLLENKVALITGASRGIGAEVAKAYAQAGAQTILVARSVEGLEKVDDEIRSLGGLPPVLVAFDLTQQDKIDAIGPSILERFGKLDILVGNAAMLGQLGPLTHLDPKVWDNVMMLNVTTNYRLLRICEPLLKLSEAGRVIMVTSSVGKSPAPYWGAYKVSKSALDALVDLVAAEWQDSPLRINSIDPGATRTDMRAAAMPGELPETVKPATELMPLFLKLASHECEANGTIMRG